MTGQTTVLGRVFVDADIQAFIDLNPKASVEKGPEAGELLPYQKPKVVANAIADAARGVTGEHSGR